MNFEDDDTDIEDLETGISEDGYGFFLVVGDYQRIHDRIHQKGYFTDRVPFDRVRVSGLILGTGLFLMSFAVGLTHPSGFLVFLLFGVGSILYLPILVTVYFGILPESDSDAVFIPITNI